MYIYRQMTPLVEANLFKQAVIIIYGPRQSGKTTLVKKLTLRFPDSIYLNCDEGDVARLLSEADTSVKLKQIVGNADMIMIDEGQRVRNIGLKLKLLIDTYPQQQVIATGSSSFELANEVSEPLTGRSIQYWLFPLTTVEINPQMDRLQFSRELESLLIYGSYPKVYLAPSLEQKKLEVGKLTQNYLYQDVLKFQSLKNSEIVRKLLEALALQIGSEVSYTELGQLVGVSKQTVASYIELLEKSFIIFLLRPFSRNLRKELGKLRKVYFYDLGIRNALINNQNPLSLRSDVGQLWENFVIAEKKKQANCLTSQTQLYFWRTYDQQEIDLVEEKQGHLFAYEIKWTKPRVKAPKAWHEGYPRSSWQAITRNDFVDFVQGK